MRWLLALVLLFSAPLAAQAGHMVSYDRAPTPDEKAAISFMVTNLANKSMMSLMFMRSKLQAAGDRTRELHPLRFFLYIFKTPNLRADLAKMRQRNTIWRDFITGMAASFNEQAGMDNMKESFVDNYAEQLNINPAPLWTAVQQRNWQGFVDATLQETSKR